MASEKKTKNECIVAEWLEELKGYRAIGTQEECRSAVEKQKEKKIICGGK